MTVTGLLTYYCIGGRQAAALWTMVIYCDVALQTEGFTLAREVLQLFKDKCPVQNGWPCFPHTGRGSLRYFEALLQPAA